MYSKSFSSDLQCSKCQNQLKGDFQFCPYCGTQISTTNGTSDNINKSSGNVLKSTGKILLGILAILFFLVVIVVYYGPNNTDQKTLDSEKILKEAIAYYRQKKSEVTIHDAKFHLDRVREISGENDETYIKMYSAYNNLLESPEHIALEESRLEKIRIEEENRKLEERKVELSELKTQILREIESFNKGIDFSTYRGNTSTLQIELGLFAAWAELVEKGQNSGDAEVISLSRRLKTQLVAVQNKEFPILRLEYGQFLEKTMWETDVDVSVSGSRNTNINFTGGAFASNKGKKTVQDQLHQTLVVFRFKKSMYRWYKGQDEYTYID